MIPDKIQQIKTTWKKRKFNIRFWGKGKELRRPPAVFFEGKMFVSFKADSGSTNQSISRIGLTTSAFRQIKKEGFRPP